MLTTGKVVSKVKLFSYFYYPNFNDPFFDVEADGILEADEQLRLATGLIAAKTPKVGCKISLTPEL